MFWDKAQELKRTTDFIAQLEDWQAQGCYWWCWALPREQRFVRRSDQLPVTMRCSACNGERRHLAALYTIASTIAFQREVLAAIEQSSSEADYDYRAARIIEQEGTPAICERCCPCKYPHNHAENHAFPGDRNKQSPMQFVEQSSRK